jgi:hypothetical protein
LQHPGLHLKFGVQTVIVKDLPKKRKAVVIPLFPFVMERDTFTGNILPDAHYYNNYPKAPFYLCLQPGLARRSISTLASIKTPTPLVSLVIVLTPV